MPQLFTTGAVAAGANATLERLKSAERDPAHRVLLKGGVVRSLDLHIGDFANGDVLVKGRKILAVGRNFSTAALVVDAARMIIMPGFVDTHHHGVEPSPLGTARARCGGQVSDMHRG